MVGKRRRDGGGIGGVACAFSEMVGEETTLKYFQGSPSTWVRFGFGIGLGFG